MKPKPVTLYVFGVLHILFSVPGLICSPINLAVVFGSPEGANPGAALVRDNPFLMGWTVLSAILGMVLGVMLLAAGIGLLLGKRWARTLTYVWAAAAMLVTLVNLGVNLTMVLPNMPGPPESAEPGYATGYRFGMVFGMVAAGVVPLVYQILACVCLSVGKAKEYFAADGAPPPPAAPGQPPQAAYWGTQGAPPQQPYVPPQPQQYPPPQQYPQQPPAPEESPQSPPAPPPGPLGSGPQ